MAVQGTMTTYDLTVGIKINIDEAIYFLDPMDTPFLTGLGADGLSVLGSLPVDQTRFSWLSEEGLNPRAPLATAVAALDTTVNVGTSTNRLRFAVGDLLRVAGGTEVMRVTGYGANGVLNVSRGVGGTTAGTAAAGAIIYSVGHALAEGSAPGDARSRGRTDEYNMTQIFGPEKVSITRSEKGRSKYGISDEFAHQTMLRLSDLNMRREQAIAYGVRLDDAANKIRAMGGIDFFITDNVDASSTTLTVTAIEALLAKCYDAGGLPDRLIAKPSAFATLNDGSNTTIMRTDIDDVRRGRVSAESVLTEYGQLPLSRNRWISGNNAFLIRREGVIRRTFDPVTLEPLAKTRDAQDVMMVCEEGLEVKGQRHMAKFTGLTYATSA